MCHGQTDASISCIEPHKFINDENRSFFLVYYFRFFFFQYWVRITHDVADVIPCWCTFLAMPSKMFYYIYFFSRSESNGSKIEKNSFRCFYRCLLRTFWACSCVLFKCPHGTRVRYMRKHYCLTQSRSSGRASYEAIMMAVCLGSRVDAEAFTLILIYYCRRGGIDMPTMPHIYMHIGEPVNHQYTYCTRAYVRIVRFIWSIFPFREFRCQFTVPKRGTKIRQAKIPDKT